MSDLSVKVVGLAPIQDDSGYRVTSEDLAFLHITSEAIMQWQSGRLPLGLSEITHSALLTHLWEALAADGIAPDQVDARLQGSASSFFSGFHKKMPRDRDDVIGLFRQTRGWRRPS